MKPANIFAPAILMGMIACLCPGCTQTPDYIIASEKVILESPNPDSIFLYSPAIVEGFDGRLIVASDLGGPGTINLDGPRSDDPWDSPSGNQIRVMYSDNNGRSWKKSDARIPMMHEILFKAGDALYMIGHSGRLLITRSTDNGVTWSEPSVLEGEHKWHQNNCAVNHYNGKVSLVYEQRLGLDMAWPGVGLVLMQADESKDLTKRGNWVFSELYDPRADLTAAQPAGLPPFTAQFEKGNPAPGILESNVVRVFDPSRPFYDPEQRSMVIMCRTASTFGDIGVMLKGIENPDGTLSIGKLQKSGGDIFYTYIPGANLKFYILYDECTKLYWLLHSQITGRTDERRRLALSFSPDLMRWTFAGLVAVGPSENGSRHYASMVEKDGNLYIVSRSGDERSKNSHDTNLMTFHVVKNFRNLVY